MSARWCARGAGFALALVATGCAGQLHDLQGDRLATAQVVDDQTTAEFVFRNGAWGNVRVESARVPVGTVVDTRPKLPVTLKPGQTLTVLVTDAVRPGRGAARSVWLETAGQEGLELVVQPYVAPQPAP